MNYFSRLTGLNIWTERKNLRGNHSKENGTHGNIKYVKIFLMLGKDGNFLVDNFVKQRHCMDLIFS